MIYLQKLSTNRTVWSEDGKRIHSHIGHALSIINKFVDVENWVFSAS